MALIWEIVKTGLSILAFEFISKTFQNHETERGSQEVMNKLLEVFFSFWFGFLVSNKAAEHNYCLFLHYFTNFLFLMYNYFLLERDDLQKSILACIIEHFIKYKRAKTYARILPETFGSVFFFIQVYEASFKFLIRRGRK